MTNPEKLTPRTALAALRPDQRVTVDPEQDAAREEPCCITAGLRKCSKPARVRLLTECDNRHLRSYGFCLYHAGQTEAGWAVHGVECGAVVRVIAVESL
jgi:hypothetical protein